MKFLRTIGSVQVAVFLIGLLMVILITSTTFESAQGTSMAQQVFYTATWFDIVLACIWVNIFCSSLTRWPYKRRHTGFIVTHIGILLLLAGSLLSRLTGIEGQLSLFEGEKWNQMRLTGYEVTAHFPEGPEYVFELSRNTAKEHRLQMSDYKDPIIFAGLVDHITEKTVITNTAAEPNAAVEFTIQSNRAGVRQDLTLSEKNPDNPFSDTLNLGPATFQLISESKAPLKEEKPENNSEAPKLLLFDKENNLIANLDLSGEYTFPYLIADTHYTLNSLKYFPSARVDNNQLVNAPGEAPNPAVEFEIQDEDGHKEKHTKFLMFPDFDSIHGKETPNTFDLRIELDVPLDEAVDSHQPALFFITGPENQWKYRVQKSDGTTTEGPVTVGKEFETGWMDMRVTVNAVHANAELKREFAADPEMKSGKTGAKVSVSDVQGWVFLGEPAILQTPSGPITVNLVPKTHPLGFELKLDDFRKVDYPGTQKASGFESDVTVTDFKRNTKLSTTISMNKPLDYNGFRIFQSSYAQDPEHGELSVFTIAKNPGIFLIYSGGIIILIGVILLFYVVPLSSIRSR